MRAMGVFVCLFVLLPISWSMTTLKGFDKNILLALWTLPVLMPIFLWILWR
jgi:ABC-type spermidine/putrescine transport system permease subunit I